MISKIPFNSRSLRLLKRMKINGEKSHTVLTMLYLFPESSLYAYSEALDMSIHNFK